jgi:hypothetical protein
MLTPFGGIANEPSRKVQARGSIDPAEMISLFAGDSESQGVLRKYLQLYAGEYRNPVTKNGKLDRAFQERDPKLMKQCLASTDGPLVLEAGIETLRRACQ